MENNNIEKSEKNLATNLLKDNQSIDMNSIFKLATTFLKDDKLMDSVVSLAKQNQSKIEEQQKQEPKKENKENSSLPITTEELTYEFSALKEELQDIKKQNEYLNEMIRNQSKRQENKEKAHDEQLMLLMKELKMTKKMLLALLKKKV